MPHAKFAVRLSAVTLLIVCSLSVSAQPQPQSKQTQNISVPVHSNTQIPLYTNFGLPTARNYVHEVNGGIATLYTLDPVASSLCFGDGKEGGVIQNSEARNRCSHIEFDRYNAGALTVGIEGGQEGLIVDLGTAEDLKKEYKYLVAETIGNGQGFASITFREGQLLILKAGKRGERQELVEGRELLQQTPRSTASAIPKTGHIYLARIVDKNNKDFQILVKLLVLKATPGDSVTFRWELL